MFFMFLMMCFLSIHDLFSYDKVEVVAYKEDESFSKAKSMYVYDDELYLLVPPKILIYTSTLSFINSIEIKAESPISFVVHNNKLYVLDQKKCEVKVLDRDGNDIYIFGGCGSEYGLLSSPQDIKVFDNKIFIADKSKVNVYNEDGIFLYSFYTLSKDRLKNYNPNLMFFDPEGFLNIFDRKNQIIVKYDYYGKVEKEYSKKDFPGDVTFDGFIYTGSEDGKIREYDLDFNQKGVFGTKGKNKYEFQSFSDIKAYKNGIFILDSKNKKIVYLKVENKNKKDIKRKIYFKDDMQLKPYKVYKLDGFIFNLEDTGKIVFYSSKKGAEGIYYHDGLNINPMLLSSDKKNFLSVNDLFILNNRIYILDNLDYKVKVFENKENILSFGEKVKIFGDTKEGRFSQPVRMVISELENLYILDSKLKYVQVFNKDGVFLYLIDLSKNINDNLIDLFVKDNELIVLSNKSVFYFDFNGKLLNKFDLKNISSALSFCNDQKDYIFVLDVTGRIMVYDFNGNYIGSFGSKGVGYFDFSNPYMIRYNDRKLYVSDKSGKIISFEIRYFSYPLSFDIDYDTSVPRVNFTYKVRGEKYLKDLYVEKSTDALNFKKIESLFDENLIYSTTNYYRLKLLSITGDEKYSDLRYVFIPSYEKKATKTQITSRPPLEITPLNLDYIFAANYKYYFSNPIGKILLKNNTSTDFENLKLSFFIKEYMDFSYDVVVDSLAANSQREVVINAVLNNKILSITETTPIQARLTLQYYLNSQEKEVSLNIPIKILSRNSMVWDDPRRLANFITINDPVISDLAKILAAKKDDIRANVDDNVKIFSLFYRYFSLLGLKYVEDPVTPYSISRSSFNVIDTVQYPRNLIRIKAGDCDDLTVLFASVLEASGIETVLMDFGDHITAMFELKEEKVSDSGISDDMMIEYNGKYYVPFEVTLLNKDAYTSISYAMREYKVKKDVVKFYPVREMLLVYEPPTFSEDFNLQLSLPLNLVEETQKDVDLVEKRYYEYYENYYNSILSQDPHDNDIKLKLATIYAMTSKYDEAKKIFEEILQEFPNNAAALNNLANIYYINSDFKKASELYEKAHQADPYDADILLNYAKSAMKMNKREEAKIILEKAIRINPNIKKIEKSILEEK